MLTLLEWEERLRPRLEEVELIGELGLSPEETEELAHGIAGVVRTEGPERAARVMRTRYPAAFAVFLVFQGLYGYEQGDYWSAVCAATGLPRSGNYTVEWGQSFEEILERLDLRRGFAAVDFRYVGAILGHAGIPAQSLPDFFEHMVQPHAADPQWVGKSASQLIEHWLSESARYQVDKPVQAFLRGGGPVAERFVDRCMHMARAYLDPDEMPSAAALSLPQTVVDAYRDWLARPERQVETQGLRLRSPRVCLDPSVWGMHVYLPSQRLGGDRRRMYWEIIAGSRTERLPVRIQRDGLSWQSEEGRVSLLNADSLITARLVAGDEMLGVWPLFVCPFDGEFPALVFDPDTGTLIPRADHLTAGEWWLLVPPGGRLEPESAIRERFRRLPGEWNRWQAWALDLAGCSRLRLTLSGAEHVLPVVTGARFAAELSGGTRPLPIEVGVPLYAASPPALRLRHVGRADLGRWHLDLQAEGEAYPVPAVSTSLGPYTAVARISEDALEVPLSDPRLLGPSPVGVYRLRLRGPVGARADFRFRIVPRLRVSGAEVAALPDAERGARPAMLRVVTSPACRVEPAVLGGRIEVREGLLDKDEQVWEVVVPANEVVAPLRLAHAAPRGHTVSMRVDVPVARLRWLLILGPAALATAEWHDRPASVSMHELWASDTPALVVDMPPELWSQPVTLRFVGGQGNQLTELIGRAEHGRPLRFDLRDVRDILNQSDWPVIVAQLDAGTWPGYGPVRYNALLVTKEVMLERLEAEAYFEEGRVEVHLHWHPDPRLRDRYIRFWCRSRPWLPPVDLALPDDARGQVVLAADPGALPMGVYLAEFRVRSPWLTERELRLPERRARNTADLTLGDLALRVARISERLARGDRTVFLLAERALLRRARNDVDGATLDAAQALKSAGIAELAVILALMREFPHELTSALGMRYKLLQWGPEIQQMVFSGRLDPAVFRQYLESICSLFPKAIPLVSAAERRTVWLNVPDTSIRTKVAIWLTEYGETTGVEALLRWIEHGDICEMEALKILCAVPAAALRLVEARISSPVFSRLINTLRCSPPLIRPGMWLRSAAGWGRVDGIRSFDGGPIDQIDRQMIEGGYRLEVTLRPSGFTERVVIDLAQGSFEFQAGSRVFLCTSCRKYMTANLDRLLGQHRRVAHGAHPPNYLEFRSSTAILHRELGDLFQFYLDPPENEWE